MRYLSFLFCLMSTHAYGQCLPTQTQMFHCAIDGRSTFLSICLDDTQLHYRYGPADAPELELSQPLDAMQHEPNLTASGETINEVITFWNAQYSYKVYMGHLDRFGPVRGEIGVRLSDETIAAITCQPDSVEWQSNSMRQAMNDAKFIWDTAANSWIDDSVYPFSGLPKSVPPFTCPHQEQRLINFSSSDAKDTLDIKIIGDDCDTAQIILNIITSDGRSVHDSAARALSYTYEFQGADGVRAMLMNFMESGPFSGANLPSFEEMQGGGYYDINEDLIAEVRAQNLPLFCHQTGKSNGECYVYADAMSVLLFRSGS